MSDGHSRSSRRSVVVSWALLILGSAAVLLKLLNPDLIRFWGPASRTLFWLIAAGLLLTGLQGVAVGRLPTRLRGRLDAVVRHHASIPREGLVYLFFMTVLFVGSLLGQSNMLMLVFATMAGPFIVNGSATFAMITGCRVTRRAPRRVMAGERFSVELILENRRPWLTAWMMTVRDLLTRESVDLEPSVLFARIRPASSERGHYQLRLPSRGRYEFITLEVKSRFPLGLVQRSTRMPAPGTLLVYPRIGRLQRGSRRQILGANELVATPLSRRGVFDDEFHRLREYRSGDNPRAIHWRSSARRGQMILREYDQNREHNLTVFVDLLGGRSNDSVAASRVESALSLALSICSEYRRACRDGSLSVVIAGRTTQRWDGEAHGGLEGLLDLFALAEASTSSAAATGQLLAGTIQDLSAGTRIIEVTTRDAAHRAEVTRPPNVTTIEASPEAVSRMLIFDDEPATQLTAERKPVQEAAKGGV